MTGEYMQSCSHDHHHHDNQKVHTLADDGWKVQGKLVTANLSQISSSPHGRLSFSRVPHDIYLLLMLNVTTTIMITLSELIRIIIKK